MDTRNSDAHEVTLHVVLTGDTVIRAVDELSNISRVVSAESLAAGRSSICVRVRRTSVGVVLRYVSSGFTVCSAQYIDSEGATAVFQNRRDVQRMEQRDSRSAEERGSVSV